jgi:hypothetical protein
LLISRRREMVAHAGFQLRVVLTWTEELKQRVPVK